MVAPSQKWLDGVATADGKVMQFVATPVGCGYSVETQIAGEDSIAGAQFEIMPTKRVGMSIFILNHAIGEGFTLGV